MPSAQTVTVTLTIAQARAAAEVLALPGWHHGDDVLAAADAIETALVTERPYRAVDVAKSTATPLATINDRARKRGLGAIVNGERRFSVDEISRLLTPGKPGRKRSA